MLSINPPFEPSAQQYLQAGSSSDSTPIFDTVPEIRKVTQRTSEMWNCIGRRPDMYGGFIYDFKIKESYDSVTALTEELQINNNDAAIRRIYRIFPAVEPRANSMQIISLEERFKTDGDNILTNRIETEVTQMYIEEEILDLKESGKWDSTVEYYIKQTMNQQPGLEFCEELQNLGYSYKVEKSGVYLSLPDRKALLGRWKVMQEMYQGLEDLDIVSGKGIADDLDFVDTFLTHDGLLSSGKEFLHDHINHIHPLIALKLFSLREGYPTFKEERSRQRRIVRECFDRIRFTKQEIEDGRFTLDKEVSYGMDFLVLAPGALADRVSAVGNPLYSRRRHPDHYFHQFIREDIWEGNFDPYFARRFPESNIDQDEIVILWGQINTIYSKATV